MSIIFMSCCTLKDVDNIADASEVHTASVFRVDFNLEDGGTKYLRSVDNLPHIHTVNNPRTEST
jgi:hypothetical protein